MLFVKLSVSALPLELWSRRKLECVVLGGGDLHAGASRLHVTTYYVQAITDDTHRQPVARNRHGRHLGPGVASRIIGFHCTESSHHVWILIFAAGDIDTSAV